MACDHRASSKASRGGCDQRTDAVPRQRPPAPHLALIDRSYVDCGRPGRTRAISNNNGAFRRDILLRFPLQNELGPFGSKGHAEQIMEAGGELRFEPAGRASLWRLADAADGRRQIGFAMTRYRQLNGNASHAWMFKLGVVLPWF